LEHPAKRYFFSISNRSVGLSSCHRALTVNVRIIRGPIPSPAVT
jgi:hypothetical protein